MTDIKIKLLDESCAEELFRFELDSKLYFEKIGFPRSKSYYDFNNFKGIIKEIIDEQQNDLIYLYVIIDDFGKIVGRVNLVSIVRENLNKAEIGYRIGERYQKKGYATKAVRLVLDQATKIHKLHRLEAGTSHENIESQIVLIKNRFQFVGRYNDYIYQDGKWEDSIMFEKILD